jgi:hypothetical protein
MKAASHSGLTWRSDGSQARPSATGRMPTRKPISAKPRKRLPDAPGVSTAAAISSVVWTPDELVTPTAIGSSSTQSCSTTIVAERSRPSVRSPSTEKGTIASSTVTRAIVRSWR